MAWSQGQGRGWNMNTNRNNNNQGQQGPRGFQTTPTRPQQQQQQQAPAPHPPQPVGTARFNNNANVMAQQAPLAQQLMNLQIRGNGVGGAPEVQRPNRAEHGVRVRRALPTLEESMAAMDIVRTRPPNISKRGAGGTPVKLQGNFFGLKKLPNWCVFQYRVDFKPEVENTKLQKGLLGVHARRLGTYVCDGHTLISLARLEQPMVLCSTTRRTNEPIQITVKEIKELDFGDPARIQLYNIILRTCFTKMNFLQIRRNFFDNSAAIEIPEQNLSVWPGYKTSLRQFENQLLLNIDIIHKIVCKQTALDAINELFRRNRNQEIRGLIRSDLAGRIVMTSYNNKFYKVADVDFNVTPTSTFLKKDGSTMTYIEYYSKRHGLPIINKNQPLLVIQASKKDFHRGDNQTIYLVPELCQLTGISQAQKENPGFMQYISAKTKQYPEEKVERIIALVRKLMNSQEIREDLDKWDLHFDTKPISFMGRVLDAQTISMGNGIIPYQNPSWNWNNCFRNTTMFESKRLENWIVIVPKSNSSQVAGLLDGLRTACKNIGFNIPVLREEFILQTNDNKPSSFVNMIHEGRQRVGANRKLDLVIVILPNNDPDLYIVVKKTCIYELGVASQCICARNLTSKPRNFNGRGGRGGGGGGGREVAAGPNLSVCTKIAVQINAKLQGKPWIIDNMFKSDDTMVVGFDVFHCGKRSGKSVGALVSTTNRTLSSHYSTYTFSANREEISSNIEQEFGKHLNAFKMVNEGRLPRRIIFYRDGVGEGQLQYVVSTELDQIERMIRTCYQSHGIPPAKLLCIIVTKRINARFFKEGDGGRIEQGDNGNPVPGTIVDDVITLPERCDFFLISHTAPQARGRDQSGSTVTPVSYNVIKNGIGMPIKLIQEFTFRLTHNYYNWSGTISVPSVCQYAHKLAYLIGVVGEGNDNNSEKLAHSLYYL